MRLNTAASYSHFVFLYIILILLLAFDAFILFGETQEAGGTFFDWWSFHLSYIVIPVFLVLIYRGNPVFTYDSDGEVIILESKNPSLNFLGRSFSQRYEFPKRKLVGYTIQRLPLRRKLVLKLSSKDGKFKHVSATTSYLNKQQIKDLERSLRGILSKNKKSGFIAYKETVSNDD